MDGLRFTAEKAEDWEWTYTSVLKAVTEHAERVSTCYPDDVRQNRTGDDDVPCFDLGINSPVTGEGGERFLLSVTSKKLFNHSMMAELIWFLMGDTNVENLKALGSGIWNEWMRPDGTIGEGYGRMWRQWPDTRVVPGSELEDYRERGFEMCGFVTQDRVVVHREVDQITNLIDGLVNNPYSRRHVVWAFNPAYVHDTTLPPCHMGFVCQVKDENGEKTLNMKVLMRSWDTFLGGPFNISSYSALLHLLSQLTGYKAGRLAIDGADVHLYLNHLEQAKTQLTDPARQNPFRPPIIEWNVEEGSGTAGWEALQEKMEALDSNDHSSIYAIYGYASRGALKAPVAT